MSTTILLSCILIMSFLQAFYLYLVIASLIDVVKAIKGES